MRLNELQSVIQQNPDSFVRFGLPDGDYIPRHAHVTEVGHVVKNYIDCGGQIGKEQKVLLQAHVGNDVEHRLRSDRFGKILQLAQRVLPNDQLNVEVEYDCCVVAQYPISEVKPAGQYVDIILTRGRTQCRARDRGEAAANDTCCGTTSACC